jgi:hypothetical protein
MRRKKEQRGKKAGGCMHEEENGLVIKEANIKGVKGFG